MASKSHRPRTQQPGASMDGMSGQAMLEQIHHRLRVIQSFEEQFGEGHFDLTVSHSELQADDELLHPYETSHIVGHCLSVSLDALRTARLILQDPESGGLRFPMIGHYPVLRTAIEAAGLATWLLAPEDRTERLNRCL